ncbi:MAG: GNAT family N-acetyltransferase [Chloroflexi bacterium]|nr:GNAT family N-acetyltransferase [Chloroflexota bacterium]MBI5082384.1 GNAT family N-acetyltransferase [Chloroflexota bacterium]MBI5349692.1 GNAT family N-acetyltransferase [Chloroflexota bacterium]
MFSIRPLTSLPDFHAAEELQRQVWPGSELIIAPLHIMLTVAQNGGVVIGAWDDDKLVGFVLGFLGTVEGDPDRPAMTRLKHCSHMLAVLPEYRDKGVGYQLKIAQYHAVNQQAVRLITWTFDPIESRNANLNIARLGGISRTYKRDYYGEMNDGLNVGLLSDRLLVEWWITSNRVKQRIGGERKRLSLESYMAADMLILNPTRANDAGLPRMIGESFEPSGVICLVEIPSNFQGIKAKDVELAREWKRQVRRALENAFSNGYLITDFVFENVGDRPRAFYVLSQGDVKLDGEMR